MPRRVALAIECSDFKAIFLWVKGAWSLLFTIFLMSELLFLHHYLIVDYLGCTLIFSSTKVDEFF